MYGHVGDGPMVIRHAGMHSSMELLVERDKSAPIDGGQWMSPFILLLAAYRAHFGPPGAFRGAPGRGDHPALHLGVTDLLASDRPAGLPSPEELIPGGVFRSKLTGQV